jgi:hypothetical protein
MLEIPMAPFPTAIRETGALKIADQFAYLSRHLGFFLSRKTIIPRWTSVQSEAQPVPASNPPRIIRPMQQRLPLLAAALEIAALAVLANLRDVSLKSVDELRDEPGDVLRHALILFISVLHA